jgi:RNA polymerase sigma-70 factor (ECF subfamily)
MPVDAPPADGRLAATAEFESHRHWLRGLAYRMLGERAQAEDVVQDAWLRWQAEDRSHIGNPRGFLVQVVSNLCLDRLQSARARREHYVGVWLPEPLIDDADVEPGPDVATEYAQDVSNAFLLALDRLSPLERAAFLLHDVFDLEYDEVAERLQRSAVAVRQLASRARQRVREAHVRQEVSREEAGRLLEAFGRALAAGDVEALASTLAADAVLLADGGGRAAAVPKALHGGATIAQVLHGFASQADWSRLRTLVVRVNGAPGWLIVDETGAPVQTLAIEPGADGRIAAIYVVRNPDKLAGLVP